MNTDEHGWLSNGKQERRKLPLLVLFCLFALSASSQNKDALDAVPEQLRESLRSQLQSVVLYQKTSDWERLFDLLDPQWQGGTRAEYVRRSKDWRMRPALAKFTPVGISTEVFTPEGIVDISKSSRWIVMGCGEYGKGWFKEKYLSEVEAHWNGERWFFSEIVITHESIHGTPAPCPKKPKKQEKKP